MALSRGRVFVALPAALLLTTGLVLTALYFTFAPDVWYVDPAVLPELRAIGRVVGEDAETAHQWENSYVEFKYLVLHLDGGVKDEILAEAEQRLSRSGWHVSNRVPHKISLESAGWPEAILTVERLEEAGALSDELREAVAAAELPVDEMVYVTVQG
ncbi:hypothetical protein [Nonomuraea sp. NPDC005650]|uniref:hypothetical protein n=1 Tax=Nonomuraea sp. NPDC005650 TaxID=3157045 RepID=UPI0033B7B1E2